MAKRKNSTALFEVMAAHRARKARDAGTADGGATTMAGAGAAASGAVASAAVVERPRMPVPSTGRSYAPPPGQLVKSAGRPGFLAAGKKWVESVIEQRRQAAAAAEAAEVEASVAADASDPTAGVTAQSLAARRHAAPVAPPKTPAPPPEPASALAGRADREVAPAPAVVRPPPSESRSNAGAGYAAPVVPAVTAPAPAAPATHTTAMPTRGRSANGQAHRGPAEESQPAVAAREGAGHSDPPHDAGPDRTSPTAHRGHRNQVTIDRDNHEVTLRMRFQTAGIWALAALVVVGLAYLAGKRTGEPAAAAGGSQTKAQPGALEPRTGKASHRTAKGAGDAVLAGDRIPGKGDAVTAIQPSAPGGTTAQISTPPPYADTPIVDNAARRTVGLNYVVVKSFAPDFQNAAIDVSQFLNANGVPNTIEVGTPALRCPTGDLIIVGTRGFTKPFMETPEYKQYMQQIQAVSAKFPQKNKLNKPQPMTVKWPG